MRRRIQKWSNSLALRIPQAFAEESQLHEGSAVEVSLRNGKLVVAPLVEPQQPSTTKSKLADLLARKSGKREYVPERGDLVWLTFDPQQSGRRPALVLSPDSYHRRAGLAVFVPLTRQVKGYPFEVLIPAGLEVSGAALADQLKSLDWRERNATRIGSLAPIDNVVGPTRPSS